MTSLHRESTDSLIIRNLCYYKESVLEINGLASSFLYQSFVVEAESCHTSTTCNILPRL